MNMVNLMYPFLIPAIAAVIVFLLPKKVPFIKEGTAFISVIFSLVVSIAMFGREETLDLVWGGFGMDFSLRLYQFSSLLLMATSVIALLVMLYSTVYMKDKHNLRQFYAFMLITQAMVSGALLANNLVVLLFFWEGLMITIFGLIMTSGRQAFPTAVKAFVIVGVSDLLMMLGIGMTGYIAGTLKMSDINLSIESWGIFAFIFLMIGAVSKAGLMPFHSWIPDAAAEAPLPFIAFLPVAVGKLLGIYFLARITLDLFKLEHGLTMSTVLMVLGAITIVLAAAMALVQKNYKRLLAYSAISQVGYMVLGIGTALPVGIIGGLFHMINGAIYKSGLFTTADAVDRQTGTADISKLGGLGKKMPITFGCFLVVAASISGVPPFSGFFSKELVFDGALESNVIYYIAALLGAFLTGAALLRLGHAAYFGKASEETGKTKESPWPMLIPMIILALTSLCFGLFNKPIVQELIQPILGETLEYEGSTGMHVNWTLIAISIAVLLLAVLNHYLGFKKSGSGEGSLDHIKNAPVLKPIYNAAEKRYFDPYDVGTLIINAFSKVCLAVDKGINWFYDSFITGAAALLSKGLSKAHTGRQSAYIAWAICGLAAMAFIFAAFM